MVLLWVRRTWQVEDRLPPHPLGFSLKRDPEHCPLWPKDLETVSEAHGG